MAFFASLLNFLSTSQPGRKDCFMVIIDEPEAPKSIIEKW